MTTAEKIEAIREAMHDATAAMLDDACPNNYVVDTADFLRECRRQIAQLESTGRYVWRHRIYPRWYGDEHQDVDDMTHSILDPYRYKVSIKRWVPHDQSVPPCDPLAGGPPQIEYITAEHPLTRADIQTIVESRHPDYPSIDVMTIRLIDPTDDGRQMDMFAPQQLTF